MTNDSTFTIVIDKSLLSTLCSAAVFVVSAWLTTTLQRRSETDTDTSSVSSREDDDDDGQDDNEYYLRRRLEHRLSFPNLASATATADDERTPAKATRLDSKVDFNPKNSNWHHFECTNAAEPTCAVDDNADLGRSRPSLTIRESLYGETVATTSSQSSVSKDDKATDDDFSLASADHFVWTEAHYSPKHSKNIKSGLLQVAAVVPSSQSTSSEKGFPPPLPPVTRRALSTPITRHSNSRSARVRASYNARIIPDKVVLVRHGQSAGNIDERVYSTTPDNAIPLTPLGWEQARAAGRRLKLNVLPQNCRIHFIVSPYVRTVETFHGILSAWCDPKTFNYIPDRQDRIRAWYSKLLEMGITWAEDPRIREQDFGNLQNPEQISQSKRDRHNFGAFYYRFANGESAADVYDRISTFLDSLWRSFDVKKSQYFVIVTHGISVRVLLSRYFRYTVDQFHLLSNPRNCEMIELEHDGEGRLQLAGRHELSWHTDSETGECTVQGYQHHKKLRVLPQQYVRKVKVRVSPDDD